MLGQKLQVVERLHPLGEDGIRSSLEEVARRGGSARNHPKVRNWAIEQLVRHEKETGEKVQNPRKRAEVLLVAVQRKLWVPDPVGTEWMAGPHLMACDVNTKDEICFLGADCDEMAALFTGAAMSVGLDVLTVGHAYNEAGNIGHVLNAVRIGNEWLYADPSTKLPLGEVTKFTRERVLEPIGATTICDRMGGSCLGKLGDVRVEDYISQGTFVGVDGPPIKRRLRWLGSAAGDYAEKLYDQCTGGGKVSTSKTALKGYGKCAADSACATYGIPPGPCGAIAGAIFDAVDSALSNAGGANSPGFFALYQLRQLHDRLFPTERKWNAIDAWTADGGSKNVKISTSTPTHVPVEMYELVRQSGWDLRDPATPALLRPIDFVQPNTIQQARLLKAAGIANTTLIERAARGGKPATTSSSTTSAAPIVIGGIALGALLWLLA